MLRVLLTCALVLHLCGAESPPDAEAVRAVLERRCASCHGPQLAKPKGKFGHVLDLARMAGEPDYVQPGKPETSELHLLLIATDPDERMPPPDSDEAPMPEEEIALVSAWIRGLGQPVKAPEQVPVVMPPAPTTPTPRGPRNMNEAIGLAHVLVLHFPIALVLAALASEAWGLLRRQGGTQLATTYFLLVLGTLGGAIAVFTGWWAADIHGYRDSTVSLHRWLGVAAAATTALSLAAYEWHRRTPSPLRHRLALALLTIAAALVALAGHYGGDLVHDRTLLPF